MLFGKIKVDGGGPDFTERLGDLTLRNIEMFKDKSRRWFPIYPDSDFKITWDMIGMIIVVY